MNLTSHSNLIISLCSSAMLGAQVGQWGGTKESQSVVNKVFVPPPNPTLSTLTLTHCEIKGTKDKEREGQKYWLVWGAGEGWGGGSCASDGQEMLVGDRGAFR